MSSASIVKTALNISSAIVKLLLNAPLVPLCFVFLLKVIALGLSGHAENQFLPHWSEALEMSVCVTLTDFYFLQCPREINFSFLRSVQSIFQSPLKSFLGYACLWVYVFVLSPLPSFLHLYLPPFFFSNIKSDVLQ